MFRGYGINSGPKKREKQQHDRALFVFLCFPANSQPKKHRFSKVVSRNSSTNLNHVFDQLKNGVLMIRDRKNRQNHEFSQKSEMHFPRFEAVDI